MVLDTSIRIDKSVLTKLKRMSFPGQSYSDLIDDLIEFSKEHPDEFNDFLEESYEDDEE